MVELGFYLAPPVRLDLRAVDSRGQQVSVADPRVIVARGSRQVKTDGLRIEVVVGLAVGRASGLQHSSLDECLDALHDSLMTVLGDKGLVFTCLLAE